MVPSEFQFPAPLPWAALALPLAAAEDALARLDERLAKSPIRNGWIARTHFTDACASLWLDGELVHLEDLVLHDAAMDVRTPTAELIRTHEVLRTRRRIADAKPDWALSPAGIDGLRGRLRGPPPAEHDAENDDAGDVAFSTEAMDSTAPLPTDDRFADAFAAIDAAASRTDRAVAHTLSSGLLRHELLALDPDWNEDACLADWQDVVRQTRSLPAALAAAITLDAWDQIAPLQRMAWLGRQLVAALLRQRGKTRHHLACLNVGLRQIDFSRRRSREPTTRLIARLDAITAAATAGLQDHDRWSTAHTLLKRKLAGRRASSRLPALLDLVMARPILSANMIAAELRITSRAAIDLVGELGLRETTGRSRYRAWGIL